MNNLEYLTEIAGNERVEALIEEIKKIDVKNFDDPRIPEIRPYDEKLPDGEMILYEKQIYAWQAITQKKLDVICDNCELLYAPSHRCIKKEVPDLRLCLEIARELMWKSIRDRLGPKATGIRKGFIVVESAPDAYIIGEILAAALMDAFRQKTIETEISAVEEKDAKDDDDIIWN